MAEVGGRSFVHEGFGITVGADDVVEPLVAKLVLEEVGGVGAGEVGHAKHAVVDHDEAATLVAVPAEGAFDDGKLGIGVTAEPLVVHGDGVAGGLAEDFAVEGVLGQMEAADLDAVGLAPLLLEAGRRR